MYFILPNEIIWKINEYIKRYKFIEAREKIKDLFDAEEYYAIVCDQIKTLSKYDLYDLYLPYRIIYDKRTKPFSFDFILNYYRLNIKGSYLSHGFMTLPFALRQYYRGYNHIRDTNFTLYLFSTTQGCSVSFIHKTPLN